MNDVMEHGVRPRGHVHRGEIGEMTHEDEQDDHVWIELGQGSGRWVRVRRRRGIVDRLRTWFGRRSAQ